jgi:hypothetical protein
MAPTAQIPGWRNPNERATPAPLQGCDNNDSRWPDSDWLSGQAKWGRFAETSVLWLVVASLRPSVMQPCHHEDFVGSEFP